MISKNQRRKVYELDRLNEINEFFELPFAKEYIRNNDTLIRQMLALLNGIEEGETVNQLQSDALKETARRLLRSSELAMSLVDEHKCCDGKAVDLADYLTRFVKKCAWVLPERLEIEAGDFAEGRAVIDEKALDRLILGFVRNAVRWSANEKTELSLEGNIDDDENYYIHLKCKESYERSDNITVREVTDGFSMEICSLLADKLGIGCDLSETSLLLTLKCDHSGMNLEMFDPIVTSSEVENAPFELMLSDFL